jgi:group I intron endonuclease
VESGIYTITSPSGKQYIGQASDFSKRWYVHIRQLRAGTHHCKALQNAFRKYGEGALVFSKVILAPVDELDCLEQGQIDAIPHHLLYNTAKDVLAPMRGRKHAQDTITKQSLSHAGDKNPMFGRKGENSPNFGLLRSDELKQKLSFIFSQPHVKAKRSLAHTGKKRSQEFCERLSTAHAHQYRPVMCGNGMKFQSIADAVKWLKANGWPKAADNNIVCACKGKFKQAYGHTWIYHEQFVLEPTDMGLGSR